MRMLVLTAAFVALAGPALAADTWTAVPVTPTAAAAAGGFVGVSVAWSCTASGCQSQSDTSDADPMAECRSLAYRVGRLASFSGDRGPFTDARLKDCNASARK